MENETIACRALTTTASTPGGESEDGDGRDRKCREASEVLKRSLSEMSVLCRK